MMQFESEAARLESFGRSIDAIRKDVEARVGAADLARVRWLRRLSRGLEIAGRGAIHFSFEPIGFGAGVVMLWLHKQLEATEIGHTALHGAYDRFGRDTGFHSASFGWRVPIDEASWRHGHNVRHHGNTNVAGKDPDVHFGPIRLTEHTPWNPFHRFQVPFALLVLFPTFTFMMNLHFTGVNDAWANNGRGGMDFLEDRSLRSRLHAHGRALRKYVPYYAYEYGLFPALAGPFWWKVLLGNWLAETMRDVYSAATIFCGHVGPDTAAYPEGDKAASRGAWYARQVEATNDFEVGPTLSVLCGGLDRQIEHHLFPKLAPERLREIAPAVRRACEEHGVAYRTDTWPATLKKAFAHLRTLSLREAMVEMA
ncbi:MAG: fatty acid desaturase [Labilithrix sp.]|nr:fatty acid desaturase [Labilithrix sp.]MCW5811137.1 fatty acid desaturase [Labilithrix sp.]